MADHEFKRSGRRENRVRRAARVDANLTEVVAAFRKMGCSVYVLNDIVDILIGYGGLTILGEVRDGSKGPAYVKRYTPRQKKFRETWTGGVRLVTDMKAVEETANLLRSWHAKLCR